MKMRISHLFPAKHVHTPPVWEMDLIPVEHSEPCIYFKVHQFYLLAQSQPGGKWKQSPARSCCSQVEGKKFQQKVWKWRRSWKGLHLHWAEQTSTSSLGFKHLKWEKVGIYFPGCPEGAELVLISPDFSFCSRSGFVSSFVGHGLMKSGFFFL